MGKRKAEQEVEAEEEGIQEEENFSTRTEEEEESSDPNESGDEEESGEEEEEEFSDGAEDDEFSSGEEDEDEDEDDEEDGDPASREDEEEHSPQDGQGPTAFSRAFGKIMKKRVPESAITEISGPVLAERKQLLVKKFEEAEAETKAKISNKEEKRELREKGHVLPLTYTDAKEKALMKLATKGVVRLFNAVSKAQTVQADADISSSKAAKATLKQSKAAFMTELRASKNEGKGSQANQNPGQVAKEAEPGWAALRTDFMLGNSKKFMDWDKGIGDSGPVTETV
ncbi:unnamed protein product [Calypogeia fissa]